MSNINAADRPNVFEDEARRVARLLWPQAQYQGAASISGRERDGVFRTDDCIHLLEATTSREKSKAEKDAVKLLKLAKKFEKSHPTMTVKCWLVTQHEPTADQRAIIQDVCNKGGRPNWVIILSFHQFQSKLIDAGLYLNARNDYFFGSISNLKSDTEKDSFREVSYTPLDILHNSTGESFSVQRICTQLQDGYRFSLLGDYGAGKSMTLREIYKSLRAHYLSNKSTNFPIHINLRDHHGQTNPAEALERHARNIGFASPPHLVRAWRSGQAILLLDGFDEIGTPGWVGLWKQLRDTRYRSVELIRRLITESPPEAGIILAGRAHYFDNSEERQRALGINAVFTELSLNEFNESQIRDYLSNFDLQFGGEFPTWLPSRPLLVGYLAAKGFFAELISKGNLTALDPASGWDMLVNKICQREANIEAGIDGLAVRRILERLSSKARRSFSGRGPLSSDVLIDAFTETCGYKPDDRGLVLLQRLPGLGVESGDETARVFIDEDLADACRAGDLLEYIISPNSYYTDNFSNIEYPIQHLAVSLACSRLLDMGLKGGNLLGAIRQAERKGLEMLVADIVRISIEADLPLGEEITIRGVLISELDLSEPRDYSNLNFYDVFFERLIIGTETDSLPMFHECYISELQSTIPRGGYPDALFRKCNIEEFVEPSATTSGILALDIPLGIKIAVTILRKIYVQKGAGRRERALFRGMDHRAQRIVPEVISILASQNLISPYARRGEKLWLPVRQQATRVHKMLRSQSLTKDPIYRRLSDITADE